MTDESDPSTTRRLRYQGFALRLEGDCQEDEARGIIDRILETPGDRVGVRVERPGGGKAYVKAEFRRPDQPLGKRLRPGRAVSEGRGYRRFLQAGLHVPQILLFGEQPRVMPRGCAIVVTECVRGRNAHTRFLNDERSEWPLRAIAALATVHDAGFVHGDAALRNFVPADDGSTWIIDLPRYAEWSRERVRKDLALLIGSTTKQGGEESLGEQLFDAYATSCQRVADLGDAWRREATAEMDEYVAYLRERDRTRPERHAKRKKSLRPGPRTTD